MNKKLSTLMASALMLAASFGASASDTDDMTNGGKYLLKTSGSNKASNGEYLMVKEDSLLLISGEDFAGLGKSEKNAATWEISWDLTVSGVKAYTFKNVETGNLLSVSDTTGWTPAYVEGGISSFKWESGYLINGSTGSEFSLVKAFTLAEDLTNATRNYEGLAHPEGGSYGYEGIHSVMGVDPDDYKPFEVSTASDLVQARKVVKNIDAALEKYGLSRESTTPAKIVDYKKWADAVDAIPDGKDVLEQIMLPTDLDKYFGAQSFNSADVVLVANGVGIAVNVNGTIYGVIRDNTDGASVTSNIFTYAAGTVFVNTASSYSTLKFEPEEITVASKFETAGEITLTDGLGDKLIHDVEGSDPSYPDAFINNFAAEGQDSSEVAIQLDFTKGAEDLTATENIFEGTSLRFVVKDLLVNGEGKSVASEGGFNLTTDAKSALMIQDINTGKYLYVSDEIYDESASSTYFKLQWVDLKVLSKDVETGVTFNNICDEEGNALPHAGSAVFHIDLAKDSSIVIAPRFVYTDKPAEADTTGNGYKIKDNNDGYKYRLGLKKFASSTVFTLINTDSDKEYKIYLKGDAEEDANYTKATTESDVYFIQLASNKADKGKYYTADGLKNLTEYEKNNYPENQWALYTDKEDSTVTIINRATKDYYLKVNGTSIDGIDLYKGSDLKADFDGYLTIPGGDTLMITPVDSIYKNDPTIGNYVYDREFNKVSSYEFTYYNGLDNSKKLNADKNGNLFIDPEGESIAFSLKVITDGTYGAPAIPGKSKDLQKSAYKMYTSIKDTAYYVVEKDGKYAIKKQAESDAAQFDLRTIQAADTTDSKIYYAFVESDRSGKMSVDDETLMLFKEKLSETRTSMFSISSEKYDIYRRLGTTIEDGIAAYDTAYVEFFKANEPNRYLYENTRNIVAGEKADGMNYLGVYNKLDTVRNASIFVDTAYVADNKIMPTYMLALGVTADKDTLTGRYLVSLADSTEKYEYNGMTRLAFVNATHKGDSLIIARVGAKATAKDTIKIEAGKFNEATFAFELVDKVEKNADADFYLKSGIKGGGYGYVQFVNGVPVLTADKDNAIAFNVKKTNVVPTANEEISAEGVKVIAGEGYVVVKGAEGKKVVVANILGQTVANTVVSSDEARIAAPAGVVVVSVEGEAAVKAVVK